MIATASSTVSAEPFTVRADNGYELTGTLWRGSDSELSLRPVTIINAATSVRCLYYSRFAEFLVSRGCDVITYDYRGIGVSRPATLRGFDASWIDWGKLDFEAVLCFAARNFGGQPIDVVGHSIGGFVIGLAPSNHLIRRVFTMGGQFAYWRDYAPRHKVTLIWKYHVVMPVLSALCGYFPARRLGWMEDTPKGVAASWSQSKPRFEDTYRSGKLALDPEIRRELVSQFASMTAPILAVSATDDEFGTVPAIERLLAYFTGSQVTHLRISPESIGEAAIGHFAFFHSHFQESLWNVPLQWLKSETTSSDMPGMIIGRC